jgi:hypothetical protein
VTGGKHAQSSIDVECAHELTTSIYDETWTWCRACGALRIDRIEHNDLVRGMWHLPTTPRAQLEAAWRERDALRVEIEKWRAAVLRPLDTSEVIAALHEGHAERKVAEHDNAWTSLMRQRDEARAEIERMRAAVDAVRAFRHAWSSKNALNTYQRETRVELDQALCALDDANEAKESKS